MQLFDENTKRDCCCNEAFERGIYAKSLSNDSFSIYGNLMEGKSISLNYHGKLIKDTLKKQDTKPANLYLYYCYDNDWNNKKIVNMNICTRSQSLSYCAIIDIPNGNSNINIAFTNDYEEWDVTKNGTYYLKIYPDVEKAILKRYGLDSTPPTVIPETLLTNHASLINKIKTKIVNIFSIFKFNIAK